ncbi:rhomboid family intramembrane serine protease [Rudaea sp.]|uniref:rhomboid family intramembrane serine protease n=1 Tax=Rudaea sp. TaxID=2136325 RepID=UPI003782D526
MDLAPITAEASAATVRNDRERVRYAVLGALALVAGIWIVWLAAFALGWDMDALGIRPRDPHALVGILTAPFVHASFEHLMSNTLPLGLLSAFLLYAYPRAARYALPLIWIVSGLGVWLFARPSLHVGISGIVHGLMFFLFLTGLFRRDRLGVAIALAVFFLYGGMTLTVLPREENVSFEYHLAGAIAGVIAAIAFYRLDPLAPRKRYSWEIEDDSADEGGDGLNDGLEPDRPRNVPVLWNGPRAKPVGGDNVIEFAQPRSTRNPTVH